jgi:hypothetical protein
MDSTAREIDELEDPENWDFDTAQIQPPVENPQAVVSVTFTRSEIGRVATAARSRGMSLTEFVKDASLHAASSSVEVDSDTHAAGNSVTINGSEPFQSQARLKD